MLDRRTLLAGLAGAASVAVVGGVAVAAPPPGKGPKPKPTPTPTPSPTPTATATATECVETPTTVTRSRCVASDGWPTASNTGIPPGTTLTPSGSVTLNTNGQIIEDLDITGYVGVSAAGCIIRRCRITNSAELVGIGTDGASGTPLLIEDCYIDKQGSNTTGVSGNNFTARRVHVVGAENGFGGITTNVTVQDCLVEKIYNGGEAHADCVQVFQNCDNVTIRHNRLYSADISGALGSSCIALPKAADGSCSNVTLDNNLVAGGSYAIYGYQDATATNLVISSNRFSTIYSANCGEFGPWFACGDEIISDNRWYDGPNVGQLITPA